MDPQKREGPRGSSTCIQLFFLGGPTFWRVGHPRRSKLDSVPWPSKLLHPRPAPQPPRPFHQGWATGPSICTSYLKQLFRCPTRLCPLCPFRPEAWRRASQTMGHLLPCRRFSSAALQSSNVSTSLPPSRPETRARNARNARGEWERGSGGRILPKRGGVACLKD